MLGVLGGCHLDLEREEESPPSIRQCRGQGAGGGRAGRPLYLCRFSPPRLDVGAGGGRSGAALQPALTVCAECCHSLAS